MTDPTGWYKEAIFYQLRIPSFYDSDGDGIGDFRGLTSKLDYLEDLGVTTLWLLPFYPSPRRDDGYDIADYTAVDPDYGTLRDFKTFLREAHRHGLRVVTELVLNHSSDQHPWFQRARRAPPGSRHRDFYVWSDDTQRYADARIIFKDFEASNWAWDPVAGSHYWHRFYSHQPDLNWDNAEVRRAMFQAMDFWLEAGVDGLRLDAVPYLIEREGTSCENLPETHAVLRELRAHIDRRFQDRMLLAEANQWPEDAVAYFGKGDECHMAFHFPIMPRLFMAIHMEDRYPIIDILEQTPQIPDPCQWALFLRNHDELTLEMVTDEERDYMWRVYAAEREARINLGIRRRLAPLLRNNRRKIELMNGLLFSLPGTPVIYYGDEIGMGDNVYLGDRNGVRTPMQWSPDRNAGFSRSNPQRLFLPVITDPEYHYEALNVETQEGNPSSLLWWMRRIVALRRRYQAFGRGSIEFLTPSNRKVLTFVRRHREERILVVVNLSRFAQHAGLDLSEWKGCVPIELFGNVEFPPIGEEPYGISLGPHAFYWFSIEPPRAAGPIEIRDRPPPTLEVTRSGDELLRSEEGRERLADVLPDFLRRQRWFRGKARRLERVRVSDVLRLGGDRDGLPIALLDAEYAEGEPETYVAPLCLAPTAPAPGSRDDVIALLRRRGSGEDCGALLDASGDPRLPQLLLATAAGRRRVRGERFELRGVGSRALRRSDADEAPAARRIGAEQSNTSWIYGDRFVAKLLRRLDAGTSPELEVSRHLSERARFAHTPALLGCLELVRGREEPVSLAILQSYEPNEGDAWSFTLDEIERQFEEQLSDVRQVEAAEAESGRGPALEEPAASERAGAYLGLAQLLGQRTAELHLALADAGDDPAFAPEPFTPFVRRSLSQSLRNLSVRVFDTLREQLDGLSEADRASAQQVLAQQDEIRERFRRLVDHSLGGRRIRCHGDLHLGQVLYTGRDFVIIDFEGEPARSLEERRRKRSPLVDVAGMLRSFDYAVESALRREIEDRHPRPEHLARFESWARQWCESVCQGYLGAYLETIAPGELVPGDRDELRLLLELCLLEKSIYEVGYELNNRPDWVGIPLRGILGVLAGSPLPT